MVKIEEQDVPAGFTIFPEKKNPLSNGVQFGFEDLFQQYVVPCTLKKKQDELAGQMSDPKTRSKRARIGLPSVASNAHGTELDWQYDFNYTIASLKTKHGPIDNDSILSTDLMKKLSLFGIWGLLKELENKKLDELGLSSLAHYYNIARDAEKMNINVKWLMKRLDEIGVAIVSRAKTERLKSAKTELIKKREEMEEKLRRLQQQAKEMEDQVTAKDLLIEDLHGEINNETYKFQHFQTTFLLDGLL